MTEFRGSLYIFVDVTREGEAVPVSVGTDELFGHDEPGGAQWYSIGWAVSKNARGTYCSRTSTSKLRNFGTFAEAMDFVRKKRKSNPQDSFHLVYEIDGRKFIITSLEQIQRLDGDITCDMHSVLEALTGKVGKIVAMNALALLRILEKEGEAAARAHFSGATYERLWRVLHDAELVEASAPSIDR